MLQQKKNAASARALANEYNTQRDSINEEISIIRQGIDAFRRPFEEAKLAYAAWQKEVDKLHYLQARLNAATPDLKGTVSQRADWVTEQKQYLITLAPAVIDKFIAATDAIRPYINSTIPIHESLGRLEEDLEKFKNGAQASMSNTDNDYAQRWSPDNNINDAFRRLSYINDSLNSYLQELEDRSRWRTEQIRNQE